MLRFKMSPDFSAKQSVEAPPAAGARAIELVFSARARASRARRARRALAIVAALAAPILAREAHWGGWRDVAAPMEGQAPVASAPPLAALPHIVTRRAPAASPRIARDGIDFTATSATAPDHAADPGAAAPKTVAKKRKAELPR